MDTRGYIFIDGSHLFSKIARIWSTRSNFNKKKLDIGVLTGVLKIKWEFEFQGSSIIRATYYFKKGDKRIKEMLNIPKADKPGEKNRWQIDECGEAVKSIPDRYLQKLPEKYQEQYRRSEKGLDIKLTCDALNLVSNGKASNIVFMVNDSDYIPLFKAVQHLGANVYLTGLESSRKPQKDLAELSDRYLALDDELESIFGITGQQGLQEVQQVIQQEESL